MSADVLVVGTGLIGTSIALAVHGAADVVLWDREQDTQRRAVARGAGRPWDKQEPARLVVLAGPPSAIASMHRAVRRLTPNSYFTHVGSVQADVQAQVEAAGHGAAFCGGHPMSGRERSGPDAATADLFRDRPWVVCPGPSTAADVVTAVRELALDCGADPVLMTAEEHDAAVALVSHLPQVAASAVAAQLLRPGLPSRSAHGGDQSAARLAGPGLQDTTRIAASDPVLWKELLRTNAANVAPLVRAVAADLERLADALDGADEAAVEDLLRRGNAGRELVPVKRGERDRDFVSVSVSVPDQPGQLAGVLVTAAQAGVNVEDVRVEHLPGNPRGIIELLVHRSATDAAQRALRAAGWDVLA